MVLYLILFIASVVLTVALIAFALPKILLTEELMGAKRGKFSSFDRGVKKIVNDGVKWIVYSPAPKFRRFIPRYALSLSESGEKCFFAQVKKGTKRLDYDVLMFDENNEVFKRLNVKESVDGKRVTKKIVLPQNTSYVNVKINEADGVKFVSAYKKRVPKKNLTAFALFSFLTVAIETLLARVLLTQAFGGIYTESNLLDENSVLFTVILCAVAAVTYTLLVSIVVAVGSKRKD